MQSILTKEISELIIKVLGGHIDMWVLLAIIVICLTITHINKSNNKYKEDILVRVLSKIGETEINMKLNHDK